MSPTLGIIGARGHTGAELLRLLENHPGLEVAAVSSRQLAGEAIKDHVDGVSLDLCFERLEPKEAAQRKLDAYVLALPNGVSAPFVDALEEVHPEAVIVDLSSDHRFDPTWQYGFPERFREPIKSARRIANPGCYATAMQVGLLPLVGMLADEPHIFGVSGYSGAGTTPSPKNDINVLRDNLLPYSLCDHIHEREVRHQLEQGLYFMPHVAPFFRGITLTISTLFREETDAATVLDHFRYFYDKEELIKVQEETPLVRDTVGKHEVFLGGFTVSKEAHRMAFNVTLDNLLKGAATQAVQNLNLALGLRENEGIS